MKKPIVIAVILIVIGLLLALFSLLLVKFDLRLFSSVKYEERTVSVTESVTALAIQASTRRVNILPSADGSVRVAYHEPLHENMTVSVSVKDGKLSVIEQDTRKWYQKIDIFGFGGQEITVYLPAGTYGALDMALSTGDITVEKEFTFAAARITQSTGELLFRASVTGELCIAGSTGDVEVVGCTLGTLNISRSTGDLEIKDCTVGTMTVSGSTGEKEMERLTVLGDATLKTTTGDVEMEYVTVGGHLEIKGDTSDVSVMDSDAATLRIVTTTGVVSGRLLTDKHFVAKSDTGRVQVPDTVGGICEITTDTGDIHFVDKD